MSKEFRTSVGGQALMEGIMMRGPEKICCAVRKPDGSIDLTYDTVTTRWYNKVPLVRGVCNMAENLYKGYKYLMHAADVAMEGETEPAESKLDKWFEEHATPAVQNAMMICAAFVGVALALFLFTFLPTFLTGLVMRAAPLGRWPRVILEGVLKMVIFLGYMFLCTRFKELHRVFEYHGAEHKTIACYEAGLLTENLTQTIMQVLCASLQRRQQPTPRAISNIGVAKAASNILQTQRAQRKLHFSFIHTEESHIPRIF